MADKATIEAAVAAVFANLGAAGREQSLTVLPDDPEAAPSVYTVPAALITAIPAARVDGVTVKPNDEDMVFPAAALTSGAVLKPGDFFVGTVDGLTRTVVTAHLDALGVLWTCAVRRTLEGEAPPS